MEERRRGKGAVAKLAAAVFCAVVFAAVYYCAVCAVAAPLVEGSTRECDADELRRHGYLGDGSGRTLASRFATLEAARRVYPHADALTDTLDWAAVQDVINASGDHGVRIDVPAGVGVFNRSITSGSSSLEIVGRGLGISRFVTSTAGIDLFRHGMEKIVYNARFTLRHMGLYVTGPGVRYAINIRQDRNSGGFVLEDVFVGSYSKAFSWEGYVYGVGTTATNWRDVTMSGGEYNSAGEQANSTKVGVTFASFENSDRSVVYNMDNIQVGAIKNAFRFFIGGNSPDAHGSIEGVQFSRSGGRTDTGPWFLLEMPGAAATGWYPPYFVFQSCNMEGPGALIQADAISEFHIDNNLQYVDPSQDSTSPSNYIDIKRGLHGTITNNTFAALPGAKLKDFIHIGSLSSAIMIRGNFFVLGANDIVVASAIYNEAGNQNIRTDDNVYEGPYTTSFARHAAWPKGVATEVNLSAPAAGNLFRQFATSASGARSAPSSSRSPCRVGETSDDRAFHYVCVAPNTWKRTALTDF